MEYDTQDRPEFSIPEEGEHNAMITKADTYSNPNGPDKLMITFTFEDDTFHNEFVTPSIMEGDGFRVFADLLTLISDDDTLPPEGDFDPEDFNGLECVIIVKHTEGKGKHAGKTFANIQEVMAQGETKDKPKVVAKKKA